MMISRGATRCEDDRNIWEIYMTERERERERERVVSEEDTCLGRKMRALLRHCT